MYMYAFSVCSIKYVHVSCLTASAVVYSIILRLGLLGLLLSLLWAVFVDCIGSGLLVASVMWWVWLAMASVQCTTFSVSTRNLLNHYQGRSK